MDGRTDGHVIHISGRIFDNDLIAKWTICVKRLFLGGGGGEGQNSPKVAIIKTRSAFLSFSSVFLFLLSFSFVTVILQLMGLKKPTF